MILSHPPCLFKWYFPAYACATSDDSSEATNDDYDDDDQSGHDSGDLIADSDVVPADSRMMDAKS